MILDSNELKAKLFVDFSGLALAISWFQPMFQFSIQQLHSIILGSDKQWPDCSLTQCVRVVFP